MKENNTIMNMVMRHLFEGCKSEFIKTKICDDNIFEKPLANHFFE